MSGPLSIVYSKSGWLQPSLACMRDVAAKGPLTQEKYAYAVVALDTHVRINLRVVEVE